MVKKSQPKKLSKQALFNIAASAALVILAFTAYVTISYTDDRFTYQSQTQFDRMQDIAYDYYKLRFCYEHDIRPCDDVALEEWNTAHPDKEFGFMTPSQLHGKGAEPLR